MSARATEAGRGSPTSQRNVLRTTPHTRLFIRCLMRDQDIPTDQVTLLHKRLFERAQLPLPTLGTDVDSYLCAMTRAEASRLIDALREAGES